MTEHVTCNGPFGDEEWCPIHGAEIRRARGPVSDGLDIVRDIYRYAEQIERGKQGRALTADEAVMLKAAHFLRKILTKPSGQSSNA